MVVVSPDRVLGETGAQGAWDGMPIHNRRHTQKQKYFHP